MDCIFCKIINGELPSEVVYEDDYFKAILDKFPAAAGHIIVIPKTHVEIVTELEDSYLERLMPLVVKLAKETNMKDFNVLQNNGKTAGQTVFHQHTHIIPRKEKDRVTIKWSSN